MMKEEFSGAKGPSLEVILAPPGIRKRMATCPPDLDPVALHESFREARAHGSTVSEAVTLVASAYGVNPELVQLSELGLLMPPVVAMGRQTQKFTPGGTALAAAHGRAHVGQGLVRKAGAVFGEHLEAGSTALATDRIIHAIDGLRKAQDEDKTGKGQVSSLKDGEKMDVFLARSESFTLQASDCATARAEQVENWTPPIEHKIETRGAFRSLPVVWGALVFHRPIWEGVPPLEVVDLQLLRASPEKREEVRQCLCLHVALAFSGTQEAALSQASASRRELWEASSEAFQHLGDAGAYISSAEAFVRHNAHHCILHISLALFARSYMKGKTLVVLRLSHQGLVELDLVKGEGAGTELGLVIIHKGHMRASTSPTKAIEELVEVARRGAGVFRDIEASGWGAYLESQDAEGDIVPSKPLPCYRCRAKLVMEKTTSGIGEALSRAGMREEAKNHGSVYGYEEELLQKAWKDAAYGAALFITPGSDEIEKILGDAGVAESPLGRVPKQNPDRTISAEGRPINDMRCQNEAGSKFNHPPAPQPRHHAVARQSLWWKARHPGIPQRCAKRDVPRAFKWHFLKPGDVPEFAVKLAAGIITLSLTMPFGWVRSPGEFVAWSAAAKAHHGSFRPANPRFNDVACVMLEVESDDPQEKERRWEDFWDALDFVGLQLEAPQTSRLGSEDLPRLDCGAVYQEALRAAAHQGDETEIISIMELLAFIVLACHRGSEPA
eukprot:s1525_g5.t2